jgi:DNA-binding SARP family transcriptional activator
MRREPSDRGEKETGGIRLHVLGCFELVIGDARPQLPSPAQRLMALLALRDEPVARTHAAGVLWPEVEHEHALANLRTALWRLRNAAPGIVTSASTGALRSTPGTVVDLRASEALARRILDDRTEPDEARTASPSLAHDLLPDWDDEWLEFERERFRDLRIHALEHLCDRLSERGEHAEAVQCGLLAIQSEPLRESACRALMRAHMAEGNRARALQLYCTLERQLELELQVSPTEATICLVNELQGSGAARATAIRGPFRTPAGGRAVSEVGPRSGPPV